MSDLRKALEELAQKYRGWTSHQAIADKLERLLAAHPEPAPEQPWLLIHHLRVVREAGYVVTIPGEPIPEPAPRPVVDREALARAAHHYFCIRRSEPNHDPRRSDYDKADEILEILALIDGSEA